MSEAMSVQESVAQYLGTNKPSPGQSVTFLNGTAISVELFAEWVVRSDRVHVRRAESDGPESDAVRAIAHISDDPVFIDWVRNHESATAVWDIVNEALEKLEALAEPVYALTPRAESGAVQIRKRGEPFLEVHESKAGYAQMIADMLNEREDVQ